MKKARQIGLAIIIVPLAIPAFFLAWYLRLFSAGHVNLDEKLVNLLNKLPE